MSRFVEIRSYNLKPGTRERLHQMMTEQALPMLARWGVDAVIGECDLASHFDIDGERVVRFGRYDSLAEALAAAGLNDADAIAQR